MDGLGETASTQRLANVVQPVYDAARNCGFAVWKVQMSFNFEKYKEKQRAAGVSKAYEPWSEEEDLRLGEEFGRHMRLYDIALVHGRTRGAIKTRLIKLGYLKEDGTAARR